MTGKIIGYIRVSSQDQKTDRQLVGIKIDKLFTDHESGKNKERLGLIDMLDYIREGDEVVVHSMDRLARNLDDLRNIVNSLVKDKIIIRFVKENLTFDGEESNISQLMLSIMGAVGEFERSIIRERQKEGIAIAKNKGKYQGRKLALTQEQIEEMKKKIEFKVPKSVIAKDLGICRSSLYVYINKLKPNLQTEIK